MNVRDISDVAKSRALMVELRSSIMLKYLVYVGETTTYAELNIEIHHHIEAENNSNLEFSKFNQDILLGGKCKLETQINTPKQDRNGNGNIKRTRMETMEARWEW